ncbi:MAG: hypothetical protein Q9191_004137, partial [Dirinaria sp. TL-2023a]
MREIIICIAVFIFSKFALSSITSLGQVVAVNTIPYYVPAVPVTRIQTSSLRGVDSTGGLVPATVVDASNVSISSIVESYARLDDVWNDGFLGVILIQKNNSATNSSLNSSVIISIHHCTVLPPGPYLVSTSGEVYQPYRLYTDFAGAFTQPLIPGSNGTFAALPAAVPGIDSPAVAVPSRLYYTKTPSKPLAGVRLGVKDIYDIAGVRTSDGNRAFYALHAPANETAVPVQRLIDAGAVVIGKMKTSQFANGELATADWVDYHSPFNPRGDGYQDPSSSSSGPGAGEASYPWLDIALGSDTGGSIRGPAQVQGLFGNRPSHGLVPLTNVMPLAPQLDTAGFEARDPALWTAAAKVLYPSLKSYSKYPKKLYTVGFPANASAGGSDAVVLGFLAKLEKFLATQATVFDYDALWNATRPVEAGGASLDDFLNITYPIIISKEQIRLVRDPFYAEYGALRDGRRPFVDPVPLVSHVKYIKSICRPFADVHGKVRWAFGDSYPNSTLTQALHNKTVFMDWWNTHVLKPDNTTCSDSLLLYTTGDEIQYRNEYNG